MRKPPDFGPWFSTVVQECLLEATTVELTIRDSSGGLVLDGMSTGSIQNGNSTQSDWVRLPEQLDEYTLEGAVFKNSSGQVLFDTREPPEGQVEVEPVIFVAGPRRPHAYIVIVDCEKLQERARTAS